MGARIQLLVISLLLAAVSFGFGILTYDLWEDSAWTPKEHECKNFPVGLKKFSIEMGGILSTIWNENFKFREFNGVITKGCPAFFPRIDVFIEDHLVARSVDHKIIPRRFDINDCHSSNVLLHGKRPIFSADINDHLPTTINFDLYDLDDKKVADVDGEYWMKKNQIFISDPNNYKAKIARIYKPDWLSTVWEFEILDSEHPLADPRILAVIAGRSILFGKSSICNKIFDNSALVMVVAGIAAIGVFASIFFNKSKDDTKKE
jgi:hypothetical protein